MESLKKLPKPVGSYEVGVIEKEFSYTGYEGEEREIPLLIFYPSDNSENKESYPYEFPELHTLYEGSVDLSGTETCCYEGLKVSERKESYPVVFYNCGYGGTIMYNTILCCDLASSGFIVVSIGHPGECGAVRYKDGRVIKMREEYIKGMADPALFEAIKPLFDEFQVTDENENEKLIEMGRKFFALQDRFGKRVKIWSMDNIKTADYIERLNLGDIESPLKGRFNLKPGIGITGHSFGGGTAIQAGIEDPRFTCCINMDGGNFGDYYGWDLKKPYMGIGNPFIWKMLKAVFLRNSEDSYHITVGHSDHIGFTDLNFLDRRPQTLQRCGERDPYNFREVTTNYHLAFFRKYLLSEDIRISDMKYEDISYYEKLK